VRTAETLAIGGVPAGFFALLWQPQALARHAASGMGTRAAAAARAANELSAAR